ncbi:hypothetical protein ABFV99_13365 [Cytobacillus horneckiae]|uniref:hypothetical protein n=1 Tax=Cytobacillus horneckiae TaxID=549687 RepID=UPI0034CF788E
MSKITRELSDDLREFREFLWMIRWLIYIYMAGVIFTVSSDFFKGETNAFEVITTVVIALIAIFLPRAYGLRKEKKEVENK